jgi:rRNA maturation protein Nop10
MALKIRDRSLCLYCESPGSKVPGLFQCGSHTGAPDTPQFRTTDCYARQKANLRRQREIERLDARNRFEEIQDKVRELDAENAAMRVVIGNIRGIIDNDDSVCGYYIQNAIKEYEEAK